eukprot:13575119-Ditylum_brightwellii.AAC.1
MKLLVDAILWAVQPMHLNLSYNNLMLRFLNKAKEPGLYPVIQTKKNFQRNGNGCQRYPVPG